MTPASNEEITARLDKIRRLHRQLDRPVRLMEVCGTHTMNIARSGLRSLLPEGLELISGPGCPVCVTDQSYIDAAVSLAGRNDVTIATYGDMVRVPGMDGSLSDARARGADVRVVYCADRAADLAKANPRRQVVFLAVGFETTTPGTVIAINRARRGGADNFSVFAAHKLIIPAMNALLSAGDVQIDGFLCPGHVSVIIGWDAYSQISADYGRPCVVAGFEPSQIVMGIEAILEQLVRNSPQASSVYPVVCRGGNPNAQKMIDEVMEVCDADWRGLGRIRDSGLKPTGALAKFDAAERFDLALAERRPDQRPGEEKSELDLCRCGDVICGRIAPTQCPQFARRCTTRHPIGPCMVSSEGACAAAYKYRNR